MAASDVVLRIERALAERWPAIEFQVDEQELDDGRFAYDVRRDDITDASPTDEEVTEVFHKVIKEIRALAPAH